jgi:MoxR-like ATPase
MMKERIQSLLQEMGKGIYEKDAELAMSLLAAIAGESLILLGPPGVAKSMVARRVKAAFHKGRSFEYLMSRFSTPDEIFGPVSISKLKDSDKYERSIEGYLPTADVVFLDEIWKAGPAIQNTLLTVMNEKLFRNGDQEIRVPLKLLVAASNELPAQGEGLEALWDRFIIRMECGNIKQEKNFNAMLADEQGEGNAEIPSELQIKEDEYQEWIQKIDLIAIPERVLKCIATIRKALGSVAVDFSDERHDVYVSDRRWKKIARLMRASALVNDRNEVTVADMVPMFHCLWQEPGEANDVRRIIIRTLFNEFSSKLEGMKVAIDDDIRVTRLHKATTAAQRMMEEADSNKKIFDNYYYHLHDHDTGNTYIFVADYQKLPVVSKQNVGILAVIYQDPKNPVRSIIRLYQGEEPRGARQVHLTRSDKHIFIDGVRFEIETLKRGETQTILPPSNRNVSGRDYYGEVDELSNAISKREKEIEENIFVSDEDKKVLQEIVQTIYTEIAYTRYELQKLEG